MTSNREEEVMLDLVKGNLWLLLILQELQEKEHKCSLGKEILKNTKKFSKNWQGRMTETTVPLRDNGKGGPS